MTDPYRLLGLAPGADDASIRAAYLAAVRACPPERDRERFEQVRAAYEAIATERARLAHALFDTHLPEPAELFDMAVEGGSPRSPDERRLRRLLGAR